MSSQDHRAEAAAAPSPVRCAVLTISDTRTAATDRGGPAARELLESFGHVIHDSAIVPDEPDQIRMVLERWLKNNEIDVIITTGGTGIGQRDCTIEAVRPLLRMELEGFGELFRMLSWEEIGPAAMLSRAVGGLAALPAAPEGVERAAFIFALPGSVKAVELAITRLIGPELPHLAWERRKSSNLSR